jgi:hypothetical protein
MLGVKAGKRSLSSLSWYLSGRSLLVASMMRHALQPSLIFCLEAFIAPVARWASGLLHLLFNVATRRLLALGMAVAD